MTAYAKDAIHEVLERLRSSEHSVESNALHGRPANAIIDDARDFRADLVVVGSRGHGTIASLLVGSERRDDRVEPVAAWGPGCQ